LLRKAFTISSILKTIFFVPADKSVSCLKSACFLHSLP